MKRLVRGQKMHLDSKSLLLSSLLFATGCATPSTSGRHCSVQSIQQDHSARLVSVAQMYEKDGNVEMARRVYAQVVAQNPDNQLAQNALQRLAPAKDEIVPELAPMSPSAELLAHLNSKRAKAQERFTEPVEHSSPKQQLPATHFAAIPSIASELRQPATADKPSQSEARPELIQLSEADLSGLVAPPFPSELSEGTKSTQSEVAQSPQQSKSDIPLWSLDPELEVKESVSAAPAQVIQKSDIAEDMPGQQLAAVKSDEWDKIFEDDLTSVKDQKSETLSAKEPASETKLAVPLADIPEFDESMAGWQPTSVTRRCPELKTEIRTVVNKLSSENKNDRISALVALGDQGEEAKSAALAVRSLFEDDSELVRVYAASATRAIEADACDSVKVLTNSLKSEQPEVVHLAAYMLGKIGPEAMDATDELCRLRDRELSVTSVYAAEALTRITPHDERSFDQLTQALKSDEAYVRWFAAVTMGNATEFHSERAVSALTAALKDDHPNVRTAAALSLGGFGEGARPALAELEQLAESDSGEVREAARTAIACVK